MRHYTSRAGDPHRHIHLQVNARVQAAGKWRGIDSVAVRNAIGAVQGIGHATVTADPAFREALAQHGFTLNPETGEVEQLAVYTEAFSKRAEQISSQVTGYEAAWQAANPGEQAGTALRRAWDARAWAEHRPGKAKGRVEPGHVLHERWLVELDALGYRAPTTSPASAPVLETGVRVGVSAGEVDRAAAAAEVLSRLTAARSAWNAADVRGEAEQLLARTGVVADPAVRRELAEDIAARAQTGCVPLLERPDTPAHIRAWTSPAAVATEQDLAGRLAVRAAQTGHDATPARVDHAAKAAGVRLDPCQAAAAALTGDHPLVLVTGAAGAGKTTTLATVRAALQRDGHTLMVVTPTLKAARGARAETGAHTGSATWLAHQHGWRWSDRTGAWTRLRPDQTDPTTGHLYQGPMAAAQLHDGDLLVVDEAGMLDQDTAHALLVLADEAGARVALVGDPHQLPAIGRGGVLDLAHRWTERAVTLDVIHRFTRTVEIEPGLLGDVQDTDYAALSLRMRHGAAGDPGAVFDQLAARGQVRVHADETALRRAVAAEAAAEIRGGRRPAVSVATNNAARGQVRVHADETALRRAVAAEAAAEIRGGRRPAVSVATNVAARALNAAIRDQLVASGHVDDGQHDTGHQKTCIATTAAGQHIGAGDLIATRANDPDLAVANRDTWTVRAVHPDGSLTVTPTTPSTTAGVGGGGSAGERVLPARYVSRHVELGYAGTIHSVQGETAHTGHLVLDEHSSAPAAYVGMTRGRRANTVHLIADDLEAARTQWIDTAGRGRPDLGVGAARHAAEQQAARYAPTPPPAADPDRLAQILDQLHQAWTAQANAAAQLKRLEPRLAAAHADAARVAERGARLAALAEQVDATQAAAQAAASPAEQARAQLTAHAEAMQHELRANWDLDRGPARDAARELAAGPGRLGRITGGRAAMTANRDFLDQWATKWRPVLPHLTDPYTVVDYAIRHPGNDHIDAALHDYVANRVREQLPHLVNVAHRGTQTAHDATEAADAYDQAQRAERRTDARVWAATGWRDLAHELPNLTERVGAVRADLEHAHERLDQLADDPAVTAHADPVGWLASARNQWATDRNNTLEVAASRAAIQANRNNAAAARQRMRHEHDQPSYTHNAGHDGPSFGR